MGSLFGQEPLPKQHTIFKRAMKHTDLAILSLGLLLVISSFKSCSEARSVNLAPPQCHPNVIGTMPIEIKKVCKALATLWEISDNMENYLDQKEEPALMEELSEQENYPMAQRRSYVTSVKRKGGEDVDHVFLRFGKRG